MADRRGRLATAHAVHRPLAHQGQFCKVGRRLYKKSLKTEIPFIGRFASKLALSDCTTRSRFLYKHGG